ncbi:MAG TPA: hypothetical protein PLV13_00680 [Ilumatobacteraceae bacterium]|nr:hypothetical protein [Ilumatobacteraceae bacterium]
MRGIYDSSLAESFSFDENDLAANRQMRFSPRQLERMQQGAKVARGHVPKVLIIVVIGLVASLAFIIPQLNGDTSQLWMAAVGVVPVLIAIGFLLRRNYKVADRFDAGDVPLHSVEGVVKVDTPSFKWGSRYQRYGYHAVFIADMEFVLLRDNANAFDTGAAYRIYWADYWSNKVPVIVSAERLAP